MRPSAADRELVVRHTIEGPRDIVFEAYTSAEHLDQWVWPEWLHLDDACIRVHAGRRMGVHDARSGRHSVPQLDQWLEIVRPERLVFLHGARADDPRTFVSTVTLVEVGNTTEVTLSSIFKTRQQRDEVVERFHAAEAGKQTLMNLSAYVAELMSQKKGKTSS
jgi:uncharacterized protein YndB with AHSA1/START domain